MGFDRLTPTRTATFVGPPSNRENGTRSKRNQHTSGEHFFLFSYRTFSMPESTLDGVVVGLTFTPAGQSVTVEADVSGEQTGDWISALPNKMVADSRGDLLAAARDSAQALCQSAEVIATALKDLSRRRE
jgi:hypothetical protein